LLANARHEYVRLSWESASDKVAELYQTHLSGATA
jgi:hypothetical protein